MSFEDTKGLLMCNLYPTRRSKRIYKGINKGVDEPEWAESAAYVQFEKYFKEKYKGGVVLGQLTYQSISTPRDPTVQFIIDAMQTYFRNWWSKTNPSNEGGHRKPDGLGISPDGRVIEVIEVKPHDRLKNGREQLGDMIEILRDGLRRHHYEQTLKNISAPNPDNFITIKGSSWKPEKQGLEVPLLGNLDIEIAWICFKPTLRIQDKDDGVVLYEIHHIERDKVKQRIPDEVAKRLAEAFAKKRMADNWNPFIQEHLRANPEDVAFINALIVAVGVTAAIALIAAGLIYGSRLLGPMLPIATQAPRMIPVVEETTKLIGGSYRVAPVAETTRQVFYRVATDPEVHECAETLVESVRKMKMVTR